MARKYYYNLTFSNGKLTDTENFNWKIKGLIKHPEKYIKFNNNTCHIIRLGCYLENTDPVEILTNKFTLAFTYKIDKIFYQKTNFKSKDVYSLLWDSGEIKVLEFDEELNTWLKININGYDLSLQVDYLKDKGWNHLAITYDNGRLTIFHNGIRKREDTYDNISCTFNFMKLGNYQWQHFFPEGPVIDYDNLILVDDCLYTEDFDWKKEHIHLVYPELLSNPPIDPEYDGKVTAPYLYSSKESYHDIINNHEVTRRKDYIPDKSLYYLKYKFED